MPILSKHVCQGTAALEYLVSPAAIWFLYTPKGLQRDKHYLFPHRAFPEPPRRLNLGLPDESKMEIDASAQGMTGLI